MAGDTGVQVVWRPQNQRAQSSSSRPGDVENYFSTSSSPKARELQRQEMSAPMPGRSKTHSLSLLLLFRLDGPVHNESEPLFQSRVMQQSLLERDLHRHPRKRCNRHIQAFGIMTEHYCLHISPASTMQPSFPTLPLYPPCKKKTPQYLRFMILHWAALVATCGMCGAWSAFRLHVPASILQLFFIFI